MADHTAVIQPATRAYRVLFNDELILETDRVLELQERFGDQTFPSVPYFSPNFAEGLELSPGTNESRCPLKGLARYFDFRGVDNAVWTYPDPNAPVARIAGYLGFDTTKGFRVERVG
ncbi:MAG: DUF427 domain-containing protein [bacterium]|nr:DUF427 domain-containing protein [bacterium]